DVTVLSPGGRARLRRTRLPGPLHMGQALARYSFLTLGERLRVTRAALAMMRLDPARPGLDNERLGDWLAAPGQGGAGGPGPGGGVCPGPGRGAERGGRRRGQAAGRHGGEDGAARGEERGG